MNATPESPVEAVVCLVTAPQPNAHAIAAALVERELAACVNIVALVQSIYRWEGQVKEDDEALLIVKTTRAAVEPLERLLETIHPYDTFELVALDAVGGARAYLDWIEESVGKI